MARLTPKDIKKLLKLYKKPENETTYSDLTPNLQAYADWFASIEEEVRILSQSERFACWGKYDGYSLAFDEVAKYNKPPRLGYSMKFGVNESDFTNEIINKIRDGEWDECY
jgi:hypothetical protein